MPEVSIQHMSLEFMRVVDFNLACRYMEICKIIETRYWAAACDYSPFDHSIMSLLLSVSIFVSWYKNSGTAFGLATEGMTTPVDGDLSGVRTREIELGIDVVAIAGFA